MKEDDVKVITRAYDGTLETLYKVFFSEITMAHGDADTEQAAKDRFRNGLLHARHVQELALDLVP